ncbi:hypothetical protein Tco_0831159 [Tanacetum coccineum]
MAQEQEQHAQPQQQLITRDQFLCYRDCTYIFDPTLFKCSHPITVEILKHHFIFLAISLTAENMPTIYIQQFWKTVHLVVDHKSPTLRVTIRHYTTDLNSDSLRTLLRLPAATDNSHQNFQILPSSKQLVDFFRILGFDTDKQKMTSILHFKRKFLPSRWATIFLILNRSELVKGKDEKKKKPKVEDCLMHNIQLTAKATTKYPMQIPHILLDLADKNLLVKEEPRNVVKPNKTRTKTTTRKRVKPTRFVPLQDKDEYDELDESLDLVARDRVKKFIDLDKRDKSNE